MTWEATSIGSTSLTPNYNWIRGCHSQMNSTGAFVSFTWNIRIFQFKLKFQFKISHLDSSWFGFDSILTEEYGCDRPTTSEIFCSICKHSVWLDTGPKLANWLDIGASSNICFGLILTPLHSYNADRELRCTDIIARTRAGWVIKVRQVSGKPSLWHEMSNLVEGSGRGAHALCELCLRKSGHVVHVQSLRQASHKQDFTNHSPLTRFKATRPSAVIRLSFTPEFHMPSHMTSHQKSQATKQVWLDSCASVDRVSGECGEYHTCGRTTLV